MIKVKASNRLLADLKAAPESDYQWLYKALGIDPGKPVEAQGYQVFKIDGSALPYFKAIDKLTLKMGKYKSADSEYDPKKFRWHTEGCTVIAFPDDGTASHYYIATKDD